jgi:hypothetical protein
MGKARQHRRRHVGRTTVDNDVFDVPVVLCGHAFKGIRQHGAAVETRVTMVMRMGQSPAKTRISMGAAP